MPEKPYFSSRILGGAKANGRLVALGLGLFLHLIAAGLGHGFIHVDEHFQVLEFAAYWQGWQSKAELPWEFQAQMRAALLPMLAATLLSGIQALGFSSPLQWATGLRLLAAGLGFGASWLLLRATEKKAGISYAGFYYWLWGLSFWPLVMVQARFSSESLAGSFFVLFGALWQLHDRRRADHFFYLGLGMSLVFLLRYQMGLMIAGGLAWSFVFQKPTLDKAGLWLAGFCVGLALGTGLDVWFYGQMTLVPFHYFYQNVVLDKAAGFGEQPFWYYGLLVGQWHFFPFNLVFLLAFPVFWVLYPRHSITWISLPMVLGHSLIGHKELRFLFPLVAYLPVVVYLVVNRRKDLFSRMMPLTGMLLLFGLNLFFILITALRPTEPLVLFLEEARRHRALQGSELVFYRASAQAYPGDFYHHPGVAHFYLHPGSPSSYFHQPEKLAPFLRAYKQSTLLLALYGEDEKAFPQFLQEYQPELLYALPPAGLSNWQKFLPQKMYQKIKARFPPWRLYLVRKTRP